MNDASEVKLHFLDYWRIVKARAGLIALAFLLIMITAGVTTYFLPRQYYSKVRMEVKSDESGMEVFGGANQRRGMDPQFVPTQFQILQTTEILYPVITSLELEKTWSEGGGRQMTKQTAYGKLVRMLDLREVRNTGLIDIGVYSTDNKEAALIANTVAVEYKNRRLLDLQRSLDNSLSQLKTGTIEQRKGVEEAATQMALIRNRDNIVDPDPETFNSTLSTADRNIVALEQQVNELTFEVSKLQGQYEQILKIKPEELREAMRTLNIDDQTVLKTMTNMQEFQSKDAELLANGLGELHPRIKGIRSQILVFQDALATQLNSVRASQATKLEIAVRNLDAVRSRYDEARKAQIEDKERTNAYVEAKSRYLQAKKILEASEIKMATEKVDQIIEINPANIWEKAEAAQGPSKPNVPAYMALAAIVGIVVGVGLAFFIEYLDTSVKTMEDVERYLGIPVLAVIPKNVSSLIRTVGDSPDAEAYRILRANIEFNKPDKNARTYTLVSGGPGEGKSTTLNNLAYTCAQGGYNVLVVDADLRRPSQHRFFETPNNPGLTDFLIGKLGIDEITRPTKLDNLSFIPSGQLPENAVGILNSQRMTDMIQKVRQQYDLVFFDSPPILGVSDGSVLASEVDVTIMVVQHRRFPRAMLQRVKQAVLHAGGKLIGVVLNNVDSKHDEGYGYYTTYNEYYGKPQRRDGARKEPALAPLNAPVGVAPAAPRPRPAVREEY